MRLVLSLVLSCSIIIRHEVLDVLLRYSGLFVDLLTLLPVGQLPFWIAVRRFAPRELLASHHLLDAHPMQIVRTARVAK